MPSVKRYASRRSVSKKKHATRKSSSKSKSVKRKSTPTKGTVRRYRKEESKAVSRKSIESGLLAKGWKRVPSGFNKKIMFTRLNGGKDFKTNPYVPEFYRRNSKPGRNGETKYMVVYIDESKGKPRALYSMPTVEVAALLSGKTSASIRKRSSKKSSSIKKPKAKKSTVKKSSRKSKSSSKSKLSGTSKRKVAKRTSRKSSSKGKKRTTRK